MSDDLYRNRYRIPSARADWHDYNCGCYFVTICTNKREHFFGEIRDKRMIFSELGSFANSYVDKMNSLYHDAQILSHVIMPNHVHLLISVEKNNKKKQNLVADKNTDVNEMMRDIANHCGRLSNMILTYKSSVTRFATKNDIPFRWQSRFHDRIIRNYDELIIKDMYIKNNISNWKDDEYYL